MVVSTAPTSGSRASGSSVAHPQRQIDFAWGPTPTASCAHARSNSWSRRPGAGRGTVCFDRARAPASCPPAPRRCRRRARAASSTRAGAARAGARRRCRDRVAQRSGSGPRADLTVDFGVAREFGGLTLRWLPAPHASRYDLQFSDDGRTGARCAAWPRPRRHRTTPAARVGGALPAARASRRSRRSGYALAELEVEASSRSGRRPTRSSPALAQARRAATTRAAISASSRTGRSSASMAAPIAALLSEDGAFEAGAGRPRSSRSCQSDGALTSWADVDSSHSLRDGDLPMPSVHVAACATGAATSRRSPPARASDSRLVVRYRAQPRRRAAAVSTLALAVRPFQVNPPTQFLNTRRRQPDPRRSTGTAERSCVNGAAHVVAAAGAGPRRLAAVRCRPVAAIWRCRTRRGRSAHDDDRLRLGGAALSTRRSPPGEPRRVGSSCPAGRGGARSSRATRPPAGSSPSSGAARVAGATARPRALHVPPAAQPLARDAAHRARPHPGQSATAGLQPGTRSYARSWIRDGALTSGRCCGSASDVARDFLRWFAPYQFANGKVPCCVDARGADPVPENDSHGEFLFLAAELYRYTRDRALPERLWPHVVAALRATWSRCAQRARAANRDAERRAFYGLMPPSISHEGYSDKPTHSYWDDFWALTGYDGAVELARRARRDADDAQCARAARRVSPRPAGVAARGDGRCTASTYLPGAADRGDFDADLDDHRADARAARRALAAARRCCSDLRALLARVRRRAATASKPWERLHALRVAQRRRVRAPGLAGARAGAARLLPRRPAPAGWNQWAEVVVRDAREPRFIGDMPHGWVASDYIRSVLDLFAYERESDRRWCWRPACRWRGSTGGGVVDPRPADALRSRSRIRCAARVGARSSTSTREADCRPEDSCSSGPAGRRLAVRPIPDVTILIVAKLRQRVGQ